MVTRISGRRTWTAFVVALLTLALGSCGLANNSGGATNSNKNLSVWHEFSGESSDAMNKVVASYNKQHPDTQFKGRAIANDQFFTVLRTGLSGNKPPTVVQYEGYQQTKDFAKAGQLLDITSWWDKHKQGFTYGDSQAVKDACSYKGKVYCIPWNIDTSEQLFYNPDLLAKYGLSKPQAIVDLETDARKLKSKGVAPVSLYAGDGWPAAHWWYLLTIQRCGIDKIKQAANQDGAKWNDPCFTQAATDLYKLGKAGVFPQGVGGQDYNAMLQLFESGKTPFMNTGTWFNATLEDTPPSFNVGAMPFPQVDPSHPSQQILGGFTNVFGISANSGNTTAGLDFLSYMADPKNGAGAAFAQGGLVNVQAGADAHMNSRVKASYEPIKQALALPGDNVIAYFENLVPPTVGEDVMYNGSAALAAGSMTPQSFVAKLQKAAAAAAKG